MDALPKECKNCNRVFSVMTRGKLDTFKTRTYKFCSRKCFSQFRDKNMLGENNWAWKGETVGYHGIHKWVSKVAGKPKCCASCKIRQAKRYEWANISGQYRRDISDWTRLCKRCHNKFDSIALKVGIKNSKFSEKEVLVIRNLLRQGLSTRKEMANRYHVTTTTIDNLVNGKTWAHIL